MSRVSTTPTGQLELRKSREQTFRLQSSQGSHITEQEPRAPCRSCVVLHQTGSFAVGTPDFREFRSER